MPTAPPLAHAFLALADDDEPPARRSAAAAVAAVLATGVIAVGVPLTWLAEHPVAALGAKAGAALVEET